jgi:PadR family transcriptional regulator PadR
MFLIADSALYKAFGRLEDAGDLHEEWGLSENNRRAKYYSLTPRGPRQLRHEVAGWKHY